MVRPTTLDRLHAGTRVSVVVGPLDLPDREVVRKRLSAFAALGAAARIGLRPSAASTWANSSALPHDAVLVRPSTDPDLLLNEPPTAAPFQVTLAGDYLRTQHDHGLGEVSLAALTHSIATGVVDPADPALRASIERRTGTGRLALRTFGSDPRRIATVVEQSRSMSPDPQATTPNGAPAADTAATVHTESVELGPEVVARLRRQRAERGARASLMAMFMTGLHRAFTRSGVDLDPAITATVDLRRYGPTGALPLNNLVTGLTLPFRPEENADALHARLADSVRSGRPVAAALRSTVTLRAARLLGGDAAARWTGRPHLTVSAIHEQPDFARLPWREPGVGGHRVRVDHADPAGVLEEIVGVHDGYRLSVSHHRATVGSDVISAAISAFAQDPTRYSS